MIPDNITIFPWVGELPEAVPDEIRDRYEALLRCLKGQDIHYEGIRRDETNYHLNIDGVPVGLHGVPGQYGELVSVSVDIYAPPNSDMPTQVLWLDRSKTNPGLVVIPEWLAEHLAVYRQAWQQYREYQDRLDRAKVFAGSAWGRYSQGARIEVDEDDGTLKLELSELSPEDVMFVLVALTEWRRR